MRPVHECLLNIESYCLHHLYNKSLRQLATVDTTTTSNAKLKSYLNSFFNMLFVHSQVIITFSLSSLHPIEIEGRKI